jgi:glutamyl-tRNA reductase
MLVVDLALPVNVDPEARSLPGVVIHGIEQMRDEAERNRQLRRQEMARCEVLVEHQMLVLRRRLLDRQLTPAAKALQSSFAEVARRAMEHALARDLEHLEGKDRRALERMTKALVKRLVQVPLRGLKVAAWSHSTAVLDKFVRGIEEDLVPEDLAELAEKMEQRS